MLSTEPLQWVVRYELNIESISFPKSDETAFMCQHSNDTTLHTANWSGNL